MKLLSRTLQYIDRLDEPYSTYSPRLATSPVPWYTVEVNQTSRPLMSQARISINISCPSPEFLLYTSTSTTSHTCAITHSTYYISIHQVHANMEKSKEARNQTPSENKAAETLGEEQFDPLEKDFDRRMQATEKQMTELQKEIREGVKIRELDGRIDRLPAQVDRLWAQVDRKENRKRKAEGKKRGQEKKRRDVGRFHEIAGFMK